MADLIFLEPVFHEKIWGGRRLATEFGYDIPDGPIGECWAISAHPHGDCVVVGGEYDGMHLSEVWDGHREAFGSMEGDRFPLLIKILDAEGDLSVQIHPDDAYAAEHENGSLGKRECWYVLDCEPDATAPSTEPAVAATIAPGRVRWLVVVRKPDSGRMTSLGMGGNTFSMRMRAPTAR